MTPEYFLTTALEPALKLLPSNMTSDEATAMVIAICLQESGLIHRRQIGGPARGYAQFELGGIKGVLQHPASKPHILSVLDALDYDTTGDATECYLAVEHNDILAAAFARCLLFTLPDAMPAKNAPMLGWTCYVNAWRPGTPRKVTWNDYYEQAWELVA